MSKHTPGPWRFYTDPQPNGCPIVGTGGLMVAQLAHSINYPEQRDTAIANARLIAAAPELLEALGDLMGVAEAAMLRANFDGGEYDIEGELADARAAIAKATGEKL